MSSEWLSKDLKRGDIIKCNGMNIKVWHFNKEAGTIIGFVDHTKIVMVKIGDCYKNYKAN